MMKFVFLTLMFSSFMTLACGSNQIQSVGGTNIDGNSSNTLSGINIHSSRGATINEDCEELPNITSYGYPGPTWGWTNGMGWALSLTGGSGGSGSGSNNNMDPFATTTIQDNPNNNQDASCATSDGIRQAHGQSDVAYAWLHGQRPRAGSIIQINYDTGESELFAFYNLYSLLVPVENSCKIRN